MSLNYEQEVQCLADVAARQLGEQLYYDDCILKSYTYKIKDILKDALLEFHEATEKLKEAEKLKCQAPQL